MQCPECNGLYSCTNSLMTWCCCFLVILMLLCFVAQEYFTISLLLQISTSQIFGSTVKTKNTGEETDVGMPDTCPNKATRASVIWDAGNVKQ